MTTGPDVALRPVTEADLGLFETHFADEDGAGTFQWFGWNSAARKIRAAFEENGLLGGDGGVLTVEADGQPAGRVEWFASTWGRPETSTCWTIAIGVFAALRGRGIGREAQRQLVGYLFAHTRVERVQAFTDAANIAEQKALVGAGFRLEGTLRAAQWRQGRFHDQVLYSALRHDQPYPGGDDRH
jgi:aminoglycoside 6'-N-acetyltransferase